jgi:hypothetical protein
MREKCSRADHELSVRCELRTLVQRQAVPCCGLPPRHYGHRKAVSETKGGILGDSFAVL